jgi:aminoglycoside phosphotransferase (APT) family kinase protein
MGDDLAAELQNALSTRLGEPVDVSEISPLSSGASRQSWRFIASRAAGPPAAYVLQREMMAGGSRPGGARGPLGMEVQGRLLEAAAARGVPVPQVVASGAMDGRQYIVTTWLDGEALPPRMLRDPALANGRARLNDDCARALAGIHSIAPSDGFGLEQEDRLGVYREWLDTIHEPRPVLELAYRWLVANRPAPGPPVVVHGDFRLGNLLVGPEGLQAVLDWELAHIGDRHEDLAWPTLRAWRFDRHRQPGTFPEPEPWLDAYRAAVAADGPDRAAAAGDGAGAGAGAADDGAGGAGAVEGDAGDAGALVDAAAFRWWQVAGTWMWAVMSAMQARRHLDGWVRSLEHATIGRRVCESEWDLLELLP